MSSHWQSIRFIFLLVLTVLITAIESAEGRWLPSGPEGGSVWTLAFDPGGSGVIFSQVATVNASSHIGLQAKTSYRFNPNNNYWKALAGQPVNSFTITGDKNTTLYAMQGELLKSMDSGRSWQSVSAVGPTGGRVYVSASDPNTLYVIASNENSVKTGRPVFYQSKDAGQSWRTSEWPAQFISLETPAAFPGGGVLAIDHSHADILYAAGGGLAAGHFVFQSQDGGQHWQQKSSFTKLNSNPRAIIVDPHDSQVVYIAADPNTKADYADTCNDSGGLFKSFDAGLSWIRLSLPECRVRSVVIDPQQANVLYAGTAGGIYKSTDRGEHWQRISDEVNILRLAIDPGNPQTLIAGTFMQGVLKTDDGGQHWYWLNQGLHEVSVFQLVQTSSDPQIFYAGTAVGVFKSNDGGLHWPRKLLGLRGLPISNLVVDPNNADIVYATDTEHVYKTVDGGLHWTNSLHGTGSNYSVSPLRLAPNNANIIYAGADFKSTNQGRNWMINTDILGHDVSPSITAMTVTPDSSVFVGIANGSMWPDSIGPAQHPACLFAKGEGGRRPQAFSLASQRTTYPSGVFRKQDDGLGWCRVNLSLDYSARIERLEYRAVSDSNLPAVLWAETNQGIFQSKDQGNSWIKTSDLTIPRRIPKTSPGLVYGVIDDSPVWSPNGGKSWETFNLNLPIHSIRSLTYLPEQKVFLSSGANGIFIYNKPESFKSGFKFMLESPATNTSVSGIGTVHGWAFSTQANVSIQQVSFSSFDIPCCSQRKDVAAAFPDYPSAADSGWGMAINWGNLAEGDQPIRFKVHNSLGETYISRPQTITVTRLANLPFLDQFNLAEAKADIENNHLLVKRISVRDKATDAISLINIRLHWSKANQSFQMLADRSAWISIETENKQASSIQTLVSATQGIYSFVDAPAEQAVVSGIGVIYGWAFAEKAPIQSIRVNVDGKSYGRIPCCSKRTDVSDNYQAVGQHFATADSSGWGLLFNFSLLEAGHHQLDITIQSSDGRSVTYQRPISVVKIGGFSFLSHLDLTQATALIDDNKIMLQHVRVTDKLTQQSKWVNLSLQWLTGLQNLIVVTSDIQNV